MTFHTILPSKLSTPAPPIFLFGPMGRQVLEDVFAPKWTPAIGCYRARNAALTPSGLVLQPGSLPPPTECGFQPQIHATAPFQQHFSQTTVIFDEVLDHSLRSWLADITYRLWVLRESGFDLGSLRYRLSPRLRLLAHGLLSSHGIRQDRIGVSTSEQASLIIDDLLLPTGLCRPGSISPRLKEAVASLAQHPASPAEPKEDLLFIVQGEDSPPALHNFREINEMTEQFGYLTLHLGAYPDLEQMEKLRRASAIVVCGALACLPSIHCPPGTVVCQLLDVARSSDLVQSAIATSLGQQIGYVFGASGQHDGRSGCFRVAPEDFEAALKVVTVYRSTVREDAR